MIELNRAELRALVTGTALFVIGAVVRTGFGPAPADFAWTAAEEGATDRAAVESAVELAVREEELASTPLAPGETVDINRAGPAELRRLPGVGPARAAAIVEARRGGAFRSAEDLERVPGIGPATLSRLAPHVRIDTTAPGGAGGPSPIGRPGSAATPAAPDRPGTSLDPRSAGCRGGGRLDLNEADTLALRRLPGIGASRARVIASHRAERGRFVDVEGLLEVPGIGPRTLERLRSHVCTR